MVYCNQMSFCALRHPHFPQRIISPKYATTGRYLPEWCPRLFEKSVALTPGQMANDYNRTILVACLLLAVPWSYCLTRPVSGRPRDANPKISPPSGVPGTCAAVLVWIWINHKSFVQTRRKISTDTNFIIWFLCSHGRAAHTECSIGLSTPIPTWRVNSQPDIGTLTLTRTVSKTLVWPANEWRIVMQSALISGTLTLCYETSWSHLLWSYRRPLPMWIMICLRGHSWYK